MAAAAVHAGRRPDLPGFQDVRRLAPVLPQTREAEAWSMPAFGVAGKTFLTVALGWRQQAAPPRLLETCTIPDPHEGDGSPTRTG